MFKPLVLIPSYNTGSVLEGTVREVLALSDVPVLVVIDGSNDGSEASVLELAKSEPNLKVLVKAINEGKGAAVRSGLESVRDFGYTHALVMDADGQHPAGDIDRFFAAAAERPEAMVLGQPVFDETVPLERLYGRKLSVWMVALEVMSGAIGDPLYGFRVYPIQPLLEVMGRPGRCDRYDFDPEVAVRLNWIGTPTVKLAAAVRYVSAEEGGVSHFHYLRDNLRFVGMHIRLVVQAPFRCLARSMKSSKGSSPA